MLRAQWRSTPGGVHTTTQGAGVQWAGLLEHAGWASFARAGWRIRRPDGSPAQGATAVDGRRRTATKVLITVRDPSPTGFSLLAAIERARDRRDLSPRHRTHLLAALARLHPDPSEVPDIVGLSQYESGRARHVSGLSASGDRLVIRLAHRDVLLPQRLALPYFCGVPDDTAVPAGTRALPMAGPYYVSAYDPGKRIVLTRNPNYRGQRPARLNTIDITIGEPPATSIARVVAGAEDYYAAPAQSPNEMTATEEARLRARYGAARGAAHQRFFENRSMLVQYLVFNTARGLFTNARLRRAVSFALDRDAIAAESTGGGAQRPTDQYLPPGLPGFRDVSIYPLGGGLARARRLAGRRHHRAVLIVDEHAPFLQRAEIVRSDLAKIGIDVDIQAMSITDKFKREARADANWDLAPTGWTPSSPDPADVLNPLLRGNHLPPALDENFAHFDDRAYNRRLDAAARLTGPGRYAAYAKLDADLAGKAAPMAAIGVWLNRDLFSARIGCQIYQPISGIDLTALCIKRQ